MDQRNRLRRLFEIIERRRAASAAGGERVELGDAHRFVGIVAILRRVGAREHLEAMASEIREFEALQAARVPPDELDAFARPIVEALAESWRREFGDE